MKTFLYFVVFALLTLGLVISCSDDTAPTGSSNPTAATVSVSGQLNTSSAPFSSSASFSPAEAIPDYKIVAQALESKRIYVITTASDGTFEFTVPGDDSYTFHILDDNYHYVAPIIMDEFDSEADSVPQGIEIDTADVDLGDVVLSEGEFIAVLNDGDVVDIDESMIAVAVGGIPVGASDQGENASAHSGCSLDLDGDGVINIMDSDDDGDGILDEFDADWVQEVNCTVVGNINLFSNFHNNLDELGNPPTEPSAQQYIVTVECMVKDEEKDKVTQVQVNGPDYLDALTIAPEGGLASNWETYNDKQLLEDYFSGGTNFERWGAFIQGTASVLIPDTVRPGDVWIFEITYENGGVEYTELMAKKINFIFEDTPREVYINDTRWTANTLYNLPDTVVIRWTPISTLPGMRYEVSGWPIVNDEQYDDGAFTYEVGIDSDSMVFVFEDTVATGDTIQAYNIDVVAQNSNGDNAKTDGGLISKLAQ